MRGKCSSLFNKIQIRIINPNPIDSKMTRNKKINKKKRRRKVLNRMPNSK